MCRSQLIYTVTSCAPYSLVHMTLYGRKSSALESAVFELSSPILVSLFGRFPIATLRIYVSIVGLYLNTDSLSHSQFDRNTFSGSLDNPVLEKIFREQFMSVDLRVETVMGYWIGYLTKLVYPYGDICFI